MPVILAHERRRIVHVAITNHPTAAWTAQQLRESFPWNERRATVFFIGDSSLALPLVQAPSMARRMFHRGTNAPTRRR